MAARINMTQAQLEALVAAAVAAAQAGSIPCSIDTGIFRSYINSRI